MSIRTPLLPEHKRMAETLVAETQRNGGLAPLDLDRFWADQDIAVQAPFSLEIPQVPLGAVLTQECVYAELGIEEDFWRYDHDDAWRLQLDKAYNDEAERIVGKRLLSETPRRPDLEYPKVKGLHDVFEAQYVWRDQSWWLLQSARDETELEALLDRVEARDIRAFILPENWAEEKARLTALGVAPPLYRHQRGPVTFATSVYGVENLIFLIVENPDLARRFSRVMLEVMLEIARILDEEAGFTPQTAPRGFSFADDNSCLLRPDMYERFGYPILEGVFNRYSPNPEDQRYQHSDSPMGHLLPLLARLDLNGANFGPSLTVAEIRRHLPHAEIHGQLAPFTYSRNEHENIVLEFLRDAEMAREARGLVFATAGSVNNGTRLTSMRLAMAAIQRFAHR